MCLEGRMLGKYSRKFDQRSTWGSHPIWSYESESVSRSVMSLCDPMDYTACQAPLSVEFSRQEYWSGLPFPSPGIFTTQRSNPGLLHCRWTLPSEPPRKSMQSYISWP